jgi:hypothetical protein
MGSILSTLWFYVPAIFIVLMLAGSLFANNYVKRVQARLELLLKAEAPSGAGTGLPSSPSFVQSAQDTRLFAQIRSDVIQEINGVSVENRFATLIEQLAIARYNLEWEQTYRLLTSHQLGFVELLVLGDVSHEEAKAFHRSPLKTPVTESGSLTDWLKILTSRSLVIPTVDGYALTVAGEEFTTWKVRYRIPQKS